MSGRTLVVNFRWELRRLRRSQRIFLLAIPPVAGPVGSAIADVYLRIPSAATAELLGLLVTGGLAALILLDLTALAVGEDLVRRAYLASFPLPQDRRVALGGRLLAAVGGPGAAYLVGGAGILLLGGALVTPSAGSVRPLFDPVHLYWAVPALLLALAGATAAAAVVTRSASEAIVTGVLTGVVIAGGVGYLVFQGTLTSGFPVVLAIAGAIALAWGIAEYDGLGG